MDAKLFHKIYSELLNGMSLREIENTYGVDRNEFSELLKQKFPKDTKERQKLESILSYNKANSATKEVDKEKMKEVTEKILSEEIGIVEAAQIMELYKETFKEKLLEYINSSEDKRLLNRYVKYQSKRHPDYSFINFKALILEMLKKNMSQSEIANFYGIPARTVSREVEKLNNDKKYESLFNIAKEFSARKMTKEPFSEFEKYLIEEVLKEYDEGSVIITNYISKEEKEYLRAKELIEKFEQAEGKTIKQKAKNAETSVSSIRRARNKITQYETKQEYIETNLEGEEK